MRFPRAIAIRILRRIDRFQARKKAKRIRFLNIPAVTRIADAIDEALNDNLSSAEKRWIDRIEELRGALSANMTEVTITDYGARGSQQKCSQSEMYDGVVITTNVASMCSASKPRIWALVLFKLIRKFKPTTSIELGTCLGISAAYQAAAHKLNDKGRIVTMEGATSLASLSEKNLQELGLDNAAVVCGRFQDNLDRVLSENKPIGYAFIDGHHDEEATLAYFESLLPYLSSVAIIVFDNISWSKGMRRAWNRIIENDNVKFSLDLRTIGICLLDSDMVRIP